LIFARVAIVAKPGGEVVRLKVKHFDSAQKIIRIEHSKDRKDRSNEETNAILDKASCPWRATAVSASGRSTPASYS
jgi:hypothetical protein